MNKALIEAAKKGDLEAVNKILLDNTININETDEHGNTALHWAAHEGKTDIVKALIKANAEVNAINKDNITALYRASEKGLAYIVQVLIDATANVNIADNKLGYTPLHWASNQGNITITNALVKNQAEINAVSIEKYTPLHLAAYIGNTDIVKILVDARAEINVPTNTGSTALHFAAQAGNVDIVDVLIKANADVHAITKNGSTALHLATLFHVQNPDEIEKNGIAIIEHLFMCGVFIDIPVPNFKERRSIETLLNKFYEVELNCKDLIYLFIKTQNLKYMVEQHQKQIDRPIKKESDELDKLALDIISLLDMANGVDYKVEESDSKLSLERQALALAYLNFIRKTLSNLVVYNSLLFPRSLAKLIKRINLNNNQEIQPQVKNAIITLKFLISQKETKANNVAQKVSGANIDLNKEHSKSKP